MKTKTPKKIVPEIVLNGYITPNFHRKSFGEILKESINDLKSPEYQIFRKRETVVNPQYYPTFKIIYDKDYKYLIQKIKCFFDYRHVSINEIFGRNSLRMDRCSVCHKILLRHKI
jgi:hypothetical protein